MPTNPRRPLWYVLGGPDGHTPVPADTAPNDIEWDLSRRVVGKTQVGAVEVSTVFLYGDSGVGDDPVYLFETMIFGGEHEEYIERYTSWQEAEAGHLRAVEWAKAHNINRAGGE